MPRIPLHNASAVDKHVKAAVDDLVQAIAVAVKAVQIQRLLLLDRDAPAQHGLALAQALNAVLPVFARQAAAVGLRQSIGRKQRIPDAEQRLKDRLLERNPFLLRLRLRQIAVVQDSERKCTVQPPQGEPGIFIYIRAVSPLTLYLIAHRQQRIAEPGAPVGAYLHPVGAVAEMLH